MGAQQQGSRKYIALHCKYGPLVRFGPDMVFSSSPAEISKIYGFSLKFTKFDFTMYFVLCTWEANASNFCNSRWWTSPTAQKHDCRNILDKQAYLFERHVDSTTKVLLEQLDRKFVEENNVCDFGRWLPCFF